MVDSLIEIKNNLYRNNSRMDKAENQINDLEYKEAKNNQSENPQQQKRIQKNEGSVSSFWDNLNRSNICFTGVPGGEEREQEIGNLFEKIMIKIFPNLVKEIDIRVQEAQRAPNKMDAKGPTPRHIVIKMPKVKDKEMGGRCGRMGER